MTKRKIGRLDRRPYWNQYREIRQRLFNPNNKGYATHHHLDLDWLCYTDFDEYMERHVGPRPGPEYNLTRIDKSLGYVAGNLAWQTRIEIHRTERRSWHIKYGRRIYSLTDFARKYNLSYWKLWGRLRLGWTIKEAVKYAKA